MERNKRKRPWHLLQRLHLHRLQIPQLSPCLCVCLGGGGCVSMGLEEGLCRVMAELLERGSKSKRREVVKSHLDKVLEMPPPSLLRLTGCLGTCFPASECVPESGEREEAREQSLRRRMGEGREGVGECRDEGGEPWHLEAGGWSPQRKCRHS